MNLDANFLRNWLHTILEEIDQAITDPTQEEQTWNS